MKKDKFTKQLNSLSKKIELAKYDSMLNADIAKEFAEFKKVLLAQMSFMAHRWHIVLIYPYGIRGHAFNVKADTLDEAKDKLVERFDKDGMAIAGELYCDDVKVWYT